MFKGTMTKWPVQKLAQGTTQKLLQHHDATDIKTSMISVTVFYKTTWLKGSIKIFNRFFVCYSN